MKEQLQCIQWKQEKRTVSWCFYKRTTRDR